MVEFFSAAIPLRVWRYLKHNDGFNLMKMIAIVAFFELKMMVVLT